MRKVPFDSPYYPYEKVQTGFNTMRGTELIPKKILTYLLDLPDASGYEPPDDNRYPRCRLAKYLWYDGANPLGNPVPTPEEKRSMLFSGDQPDLNTDEQKAAHPQGYRIYPMQYWLPSNLEANTVLKCYIGRVSPEGDFKAAIGIQFEIITNYMLESTMRTDAESRVYAIEQCIVEALNGVNIVGIGTMQYNRYAFPDAGSRPYHDDGLHVYRILTMSATWAESEKEQL